MHPPIGVRAAILLLALCAATTSLRGQEHEGDPWAEGPGGRHLLEMDEEEEWDEPWMMRRGYPGGGMGLRLWRCRMDGLESAKYSIAELLLQRGDAKAAIATLQEVAEGAQSDQLRDFTHFNLGRVHNRLGNVERAAEHYRRVSGLLRHKATRRVLRMLAAKGKPDEAAKVAEQLLAQAKEKGEKLALLHQLALAFTRANQTDRALATYKRIAKEFTPDDMTAMRQAIEREVAAAIRKLQEAQRDGDHHAVERLRNRLRQARLAELQAARRWDELAAFEKAVEKGFRRLDRDEGEDVAPAEFPPPRRGEF